MKILEIRQQIRFNLEQLSVKNEHHKFENICRDFSKIRICRNILPATGPVSGGGDNGRDFETYKSPNVIKGFPVAISENSGSTREFDLYFSCSLNKNIFKKIKDDIKNIFLQKDITVSKRDIIYFCTANLQVSKRIKLQNWCKNEFEVELQVFDGESLSELLTDQDLFWIAIEYLHIPAEWSPLPDNKDKWYIEYKQKWIYEQKSPINFADFWQIKCGIRYSTFNDTEKVHLDKWIKAISVFLDSPLPTLKRKAQYEVCVASLRGLNNLNNYKHLVIDYFSNIKNLMDIDDLNDAVVLLSYCYGAFSRTIFSMDKNELYSIFEKLKNHLTYLITYNNNPQIKCLLLERQIRLNLLDIHHGIMHENIQDHFFSDLEKLLPLIEKSPFFPLEFFCEVVNQLYVDWFGSEKRFDNITERIDKLLSNRIGNFAIAESCRDRGIKLYNNGSITKAISEFRKAIYYWSTYETAVGSILGMLTTSEFYNELGLHYAAKYYALGAARLSNFNQDSDGYLIPKSFAQVSKIFYCAGEYLNYFLVAKKFIGINFTFNADYLNLDKNEDLKVMLDICRKFSILSYFFAPSMLSVLKEFKETTFLDESIITDYDLIKNNVSISQEKLWGQLEENFMGKPFSDTGIKRNISWKALSINWTVTFNNDFDSMLAGEEFTAILQIMLVEVSTISLEFLPLSVIVIISLIDGISDIKDESDNSTLIFQISLSKKINIQERYNNCVSYIIDILSKCSVIQQHKLRDIIVELLKETQNNKTFYIWDYQELYKFCISEALFNSLETLHLTPIGVELDFNVKEHERLKQQSKEGLLFDKRQALINVENRYKYLTPMFNIIWRKILKVEKYKQYFVELCGDGYKDWHIMLIVCNTVAQYIVKTSCPQGVSSLSQKEFLSQMRNIIIDANEHVRIRELNIDLISIDKFEIQKKMSFCYIMQTWGLIVNTKTLVFESIKVFMESRYMIFDIDIEHTPIFLC